MYSVLDRETDGYFCRQMERQMDRHLFRQTFFRWTEANGQTVFSDRQTLFLETERLIFRKTDRETEETETFLDRETDGQVLFSDRHRHWKTDTLF